MYIIINNTYREGGTKSLREIVADLIPFRYYNSLINMVEFTGNDNCASSDHIDQARQAFEY
jgi:hypothetical protein